MPKKTFLNGYPLPASDLNTYLMDQSVMTFASATARTSALPAPTEGMTTYLEDLNQVQVYNGSSWEGLVTTTNVGTLAPQGNAVINGGFDIWQRGTSITISNTRVYTADLLSVSAFAATVSRQLTNDTTNLPFIQYCARVQRNSGATSTLPLTAATPLETINSLPFRGKAVTMSFYVRAGANYSAASNALAVTLYSGTGTEALPQAHRSR